MKRFIISILVLALTFSYTTMGFQNILAAPIEPLGDALFVASTPSVDIEYTATLIDGSFTFNTSGTYSTINENLNNGFEVQITAGGGDLVLTGTQTANLRINNANNPINIVNGNFNKTIYVENANVNLVNTRVDTTNNYAIDVNSHVRFYVDSNSYVKAVNTYTSSIIVNQNKTDIQFVIDGTVESNQQVIGVDDFSKVDSIIINGKLISNANFGLIATKAGEIGYIELSSTSQAINPLGLVVYDATSQGKLGDVVLNGVSDSRILVTVGGSASPSTAGNITLNGQAIVHGGAFYLNGTIPSLTISAGASIEQVINNYGILYTNTGTNLGSYNVLGTITASYLLVDSYAGSHIKDLIINPVDLKTSSIVTVLSMLWITGHVENLTVSPSVFEVAAMDEPFNFRGGSVIDSLVINQSIIDTQGGTTFNNIASSNIASLQLVDTLLFGDALNVRVATQLFNHIEPTILTSNLVSSGGVVTLDVELPDLAALPNFSLQGVKLTYMFDDYTHGGDFMYYGGVQNVTVPSSIISAAKPFRIVNYAQYSNTDTTILTSNRSIPYEVTSYQLTFDLNGGTGTLPPAQSLIEGAKATPVATPTKTGYTFTHWNTAQDDSGTVWDFSTTAMPANAVILYAQWEKLPDPVNPKEPPKNLPKTGGNGEILILSSMLMSAGVLLLLKFKLKDKK